MAVLDKACRVELEDHYREAAGLSKERFFITNSSDGENRDDNDEGVNEGFLEAVLVRGQNQWIHLMKR